MYRSGEIVVRIEQAGDMQVRSEPTISIDTTFQFQAQRILYV
jgi:hypothetical protein